MPATGPSLFKMRMNSNLIKSTNLTYLPTSSSSRAFRNHSAFSRISSTRLASSKSIITTQLTPEKQDPLFDVSSTVVNPAFRVKIDSTHTDGSDQARTTLRILFVSESGVCRGPLAAAAFAAAASKQGLALSGADSMAIECSAAASRDYCVDQPPEASAFLAAECLGWTLPQDYTARVFLPSSDLAKNDLILVVDKFTAADVLREASVFDTIYLEAGFSGRVRNLGEFHPSATVKLSDTSSSGNAPNSSGGGGGSNENKVFEINDPLYGNIGGEEEEDTVYKSALDIQQCCNGLVDFLISLNSDGNGDADVENRNKKNLRVAVEKWLQHAEGVEWMRPPLLSPR
jgi:protein-tyrosine-phosphatase